MAIPARKSGETESPSVRRTRQAAWSTLPAWLRPLTLSTPGICFVTLLVRRIRKGEDMEGEGEGSAF